MCWTEPAGHPSFHNTQATKCQSHIEGEIKVFSLFFWYVGMSDCNLLISLAYTTCGCSNSRFGKRSSPWIRCAKCNLNLGKAAKFNPNQLFSCGSVTYCQHRYDRFKLRQFFVLLHSLHAAKATHQEKIPVFQWCSVGRVRQAGCTEHNQAQ